ncbi:MAG: hypothetical protein KF833_19070 [Verrucomicrobiae bacterium]|nr:hypothetical protein [Verrucomicrobiae bacterium]
MNRDQARHILSLWRPEPHVPDDPEWTRALDLAARDPELRDWFERHRAFQAGTRLALRKLPPPPGLADRILRQTATPSRRSLLPFPPAWLAAAACLVIALVLFALRPSGRERADFPTFADRMVRTVLREYRMDLVTADLDRIRNFLESREAPASFPIPEAFARIPPAGCGILSWQGHKVAMVCLDGAERGMFYLFVVSTRSLHGRLPDQPTQGAVNRLGTVAWTADNLLFLLAGDLAPEALQRLLLDPSAFDAARPAPAADSPSHASATFALLPSPRLGCRP